MISAINIAQPSIQTRAQKAQQPIQQASVKHNKSDVSFQATYGGAAASILCGGSAIVLILLWLNGFINGGDQAKAVGGAIILGALSKFFWSK